MGGNRDNHKKSTFIPKIKSAAQSARTVLFGDNRFWTIDGSNRAAYLLPIRLTMIYLIVSVLIYAFGPIAWTTYAPVLFYTLLALYMAALWFGYRVGLMRKFSNAIEWKESYTDKALGVLSVLIVVNFLIYVVNIFREYGHTSFDFPELWKQMLIGIKDPGLGYNLRIQRIAAQGTDVIGGSLFSLFNYCWAFVRYPILIFSMIYFKRVHIVGKIFTVLYLVVMVLFYLSIGTTIDVFHVFLLLEIGPLLNVFGSWHKKEMTKGKALRFAACVLAGFIFIGCYFTWMMLSRGGINDYDHPNFNIGGVQLDKDIVGGEQNTTPPATQDTTPPATQDTTPPATQDTTPPATQDTTPPATQDTTPPATQDTTSAAPTTPATGPEKPSTEQNDGFQVPPIIMKFWISFSSYLTQGYYGMSQGVTLPWEPMFGVGNSMFLVNFISEHVYDIDPHTYQVRIEEAYGWGADIRWHSMYTWLANDFSFYGVIIAMFLIGALFAMMFKDAITTKNPFAKASIFYFILMMFFIPCNNQIAQRADTLLSFLLLVLCWLLTKHPPKFLKKWISK